MRYIYRCFAAVLVLMLVCTSSALAVSALTLEAVACSPESRGRLDAVVSSDYSDDEDLNFSAKTENGTLQVESAVSLRKEGTSWFIVLDYDRDSAWTVEPVMRTERRVLSRLGQILMDSDEGALVLAVKNPQINVQHAESLRQLLEVEPGYTDTDQLGSTLKSVMEYIDENRANLMPNVAVVVVTSGLVNREMIDGIQNDSFKSVLTQYPHITTHIICTVAPVDTVPVTNENSWRSRAVRLAGYAEMTLSGRGVVTEALRNEDADQAVEIIRETERRLVRLTLNPLTSANVGKTLTITQTTTGGKTLEVSKDISQKGTAYDNWVDYWKNPLPTYVPGPGPTPNYPDVEKYIPFSKASTYVLSEYSDNSIQSASNTLPIEWIVAIAVGVVLLALAIALILVRRKGKKKVEASPVSMNVPVAQPSQTVVVLQDASGRKLTGTMRNGKLTIGRYAAKGAMLVIADDIKLSGLHATLAKSGSGITITDNGSTNGTKVNGTAISGTVALKQNDSVTMGSNTYKVTWR